MNDLKLFSDKYVLIINQTTFKRLKKFEQVGDKSEAGGILLGKVAIKNHQTTIVITDISTPNKIDYRSRFRFIRRKQPAQKIINAKWEKSDGKINYLGEWHTHPEYDPIPSSYDKRMIKKTNNRVKSDIYFTLLLILGTNNTLWAGVRDKKKLVTLNLDSY